MEHQTKPTNRPVRRAKAQAIEMIREYSERQASRNAARAGDASAPKYDDYGLLETDSDDSDYDPDEASSSEEEEASAQEDCDTVDDEEEEEEEEA